MDSLGGGFGNADLSKLSDRDKQELQQFAMNEGQKARIQSCMSYSFSSRFPYCSCSIRQTCTSSLIKYNTHPKQLSPWKSTVY
jgi:hypothetical protein